MKKILNAIDRLEDYLSVFRNKRVGITANFNSYNRKFQFISDLFRKHDLNVAALFGPQHGIFVQTQDNMIEWNDQKKSGVPVYSLYGKHREIQDYMAENIDVMVFDLQDIGTRYYTYIWTLYYLIKVCGKKDIPLIVLDRINPLNGKTIEGPVQESDFLSFVGLHPIPVRHGMTAGELALLFNKVMNFECNLEIIEVENWTRSDDFSDTDLDWFLPSPNMPSFNTALVYPGMCLLEATNISEGRGTTRPFEIFGAPFLNCEEFIKELERYSLPGVSFYPYVFKPTFNKFTDKNCNGFFLNVYDKNEFRPFLTGVLIIYLLKKLYPNHFKWKEPPYEYEYQKMPIDILYGSSSFREMIDKDNFNLTKLEEKWNHDKLKFSNLREEFLLYE